MQVPSLGFLTRKDFRLEYFGPNFEFQFDRVAGKKCVFEIRILHKHKCKRITAFLTDEKKEVVLDAIFIKLYLCMFSHHFLQNSLYLMILFLFDKVYLEGGPIHLRILIT